MPATRLRIHLLQCSPHQAILSKMMRTCYGDGRNIEATRRIRYRVANGFDSWIRFMASNARFAEVAAIAGDPTRAGMLHALMDGRALTASELAHVAGIAPQTASGHLARMTAVGILIVEKQGRHRYHRLATAAVAHMLESIMQVASELEPARKRLVVGPRDAALRKARTCYDHLAGQLGVALADALVAAGHAELASDGGIVTDTGVEFLGRVGIDMTAMRAQRARKSGRVLCRPCLDWSERRPHLAGMVGSAICTHSFDMGWIRRSEGTRAVLITPKGQRVFREEFGLQLT
jgi:DNA-binding transcriptional ArsR family regulator